MSYKDFIHIRNSQKRSKIKVLFDYLFSETDSYYSKVEPKIVISLLDELEISQKALVMILKSQGITHATCDGINIDPAGCKHGKIGCPCDGSCKGFVIEMDGKKIII